jgi:hypothetical protein
MVLSQFIQVGYRQLRPSFIHGFYCVGKKCKTEVQVYYDGAWTDVGTFNSSDEAWEFIEEIKEEMVGI